MGNLDFIKMTIPAKEEYIAVIRLTISGIANRIGFSYEDIEDMKIAVSEAITNAITHAYNDENSGEITLGFGIFKDKLEVIVSDTGESFDFDEVRERIGPYKNEQPIESMQQGGFGLFLIQALMDEVKIEDNQGTIVIMTKYLNETEVGLDGDQVSTTK